MNSCMASDYSFQKDEFRGNTVMYRISDRSRRNVIIHRKRNCSEQSGSCCIRLRICRLGLQDIWNQVSFSAFVLRNFSIFSQNPNAGWTVYHTCLLHNVHICRVLTDKSTLNRIVIVCYLLFGIGFGERVYWFYFSKIIYSGTSPLLRSYIARHTSEENRSTAYALQTGASVLSAIVGPREIFIALNSRQFSPFSVAQISFAGLPYPGARIIYPNINLNIFTGN